MIMKKVDFGKVKVQLTFEGDPVEFNMRKIIGNMIRQNTNDIGLDEFAKKVYFSDGPVEIPDEYIRPILNIVKSSMTVPAQKALNELLINKI